MRPVRSQCGMVAPVDPIAQLDDGAQTDGVAARIRDGAAEAVAVFDFQYRWADCASCAARAVPHCGGRVGTLAGTDASTRELRPLRQDTIQRSFQEIGPACLQTGR